MADVKWIKITTDIFDNKKIKQIESMPEGDTLIVIWYKILCLAGNINDNGAVYFTTDLPYTDEMLAVAFNRPLKIIKLALSVFTKFKMIKIHEDFIYISNWEKYQNIEGMERIREQTRLRVAKFREQKKLCNVTGNATVTQCNALDIDIEEDKDIDIEKDINNDIMSVSEETNIKVLTVFSTWNQCKSVIKHKEVTDVRKKAIEKALKNYKVEAIIAAINHYDIILASKWYFKYKWSLEDFLNQKNAMPTFMDEGSNWCSFNEDLKKNPYLIPQAEPQREVSQSVKDFLKSIK